MRSKLLSSIGSLRNKSLTAEVKRWPIGTDSLEPLEPFLSCRLSEGVLELVVGGWLMVERLDIVPGRATTC
jgi:hypothetical protein